MKRWLGFSRAARSGGGLGADGDRTATSRLLCSDVARLRGVTCPSLTPLRWLPGQSPLGNPGVP